MNLVITNVRLIDGTGQPPRDGVNVTIMDGRFTQIGTHQRFPRHARMIDGTGMALIPGLIDAHKHMMNNGGSHMAVGLTLDGVKRNLATMVRGGVTTILDLGSADAAQLTRFAPLEKPRIHTAVSIVTNPGGYPAEYMPKRFYRMGAVRECQSPKTIRQTVRRLAMMGVSAIKTAVVSRTFDGHPVQGWNDQQLTALTNEAHRHGLPVCAHITYARDYAQAVRCGIDSVHHAPFDGPVSDQVLDEMIEAGMIFVPTVSLASLLLEGLENHWCDNPTFTRDLPQALVENMRTFTHNYEQCVPDQPVPGFFVSLPKQELDQVLENQMSNLSRFIQRGGCVALGTDSALGFSMHGTPVRELELLVACGLSPVQAIQAASQTATQVFRAPSGLGPIRCGGLADCLLVPASITTSISEIASLHMVIQGGRVIVDHLPQAQRACCG